MPAHMSCETQKRRDWKYIRQATPLSPTLGLADPGGSSPSRQGLLISLEHRSHLITEPNSVSPKTGPLDPKRIRCCSLLWGHRQPVARP
jgi:hypothetical protein